MDDSATVEDTAWAQCLDALPRIEQVKMLHAAMELLGNSQALSDTLESELYILQEQVQRHG